MDSLTNNGVHVETDKLWALYTSLDEKFKQILSDTQYLEYEQLQSGRIETFRVKK